jgi:pimeloyl-ACP methyl ester carboxylesterase
MKWLHACLCVYMGLSTQVACALTTTQVLDLPTRPGVTMRAVVITPPEPKAAVILLPGGHGGLQIFPNGSMRWGDNNFLVRTRELFADQGLVVAVVDAPSDRMRTPFLTGFRQSSEHAQDLKLLIAWLRLQAGVPIWLVGTSRGTESAASAGIKLEGMDGLRGMVLTSSILVDPKTTALPEMPIKKIQGPVLIVHHEFDSCSATLFSDLPKLKAELNPNAAHEVMIFQGGVTQGNPCQAMAHHGYNGIESEVVRKIADWVVSH